MRHHVLRLQIVMHESTVVHGLQPLHHLDAQCYHSLQFELSSVLYEEPLKIHVIPGHDDKV